MSDDTPSSDRKPRVALLGEFSAGKSTLTNVLLGAATAHVQVTATQLPPVWYSFGTQAPQRIDLEGAPHDLDSDEIADVPLAETRALRVFVDAPMLEQMDLIDMPGSSDPNLSPDAWDALMPEFDAVVWCTPATQAWRQSEAAIWENVPDRLYARSILLLTRIDKIASDTDRTRVLNRLVRETDGQFVDVLPVALRDALAAETGSPEWEASGMKAVADMIGALTDGPPAKAGSPRRVSRAEGEPGDRQSAVILEGPTPQRINPSAADEASVTPRRVVGSASARRAARPSRGDGPMI